jgi:hypothetical protein
LTIICAYHKPGVGTWIGSDIQETENGQRSFLLHSKWARGESWAASGAGWSIHLNVLHSQADYLLADGLSPEIFRERFRNSLLAAGVRPQGERLLPDLECSLLLAGSGGLYDFDEHLQYTKRVGFVAKGSGERYAYGAAHALEPETDDPMKLLYVSMCAAIHHDVHCGGKPVIGFIPARGE